MSRLIVKNLPKKVTEQELRELFSEKGTITDLQLKATSQGKFRHFAFVGYRNEEEAQEAINYFDKMCLKTSRLIVELCTPLGVSKEAKKQAKEMPPAPPVEPKAQKKKLRKKDDLLAKYLKDPQFRELMTKYRNTEEVVNEDHDKQDVEDNNAEESCEEKEEESRSAEKLANFKISDDEYKKNLMNTTSKVGTAAATAKKEEPKQHKHKLFYVKLKDLAYSCKKKDVKDFLKPLVPFTIRLPPKIKGIAYAGFKDEKNRNKALLKDRSFLSGKRVNVVKYENESAQNKESGDSKPSKWKKQQEQLEQDETVAESGRIFARNLSYTVTESDLEQLFAKYGPIAEINFPIDHFTGKPKGFATITYVVPENAVQAFSELDGSVFQGRMLHLLPGKTKDADSSQKEDDPSYKKKKQAETKKQASSSHNWNSLFLGSNAVAGALANTFGVQKADILTPHGSDNAAVRLALGETQIVAETRKYLEEHGVVLDAFNTPNAERSDTIILVKNLPSKTAPEEIRQVFKEFGVIGRVILPPSGLAAIVEFLEPSEAKKAFKKLVYKRFKSVPLFLEWAPKETLRAAELERKKEAVQPEKVEEVEQEEEVEEEPEEGTVLFVKNLKFETTDESLRKHFEGCGKLKYARVSMKLDKDDPKRQLSMGYGFVQYIYKKSADAALKNLQQSQLDGKSLELKRSDRASKDELKAPRKTAKQTKQTGTKLLVRNVPFQATKKDLQELFQTFGEIKALRMPKKQAADAAQSNRGFAFVDFSTENDAKAAFDALCQSTHLFGRRLVLEWAATEENVEQIRKRTADHFQTERAVKSKKSTFSLE